MTSSQVGTIKKLLNDPREAVDEMLEGFVEAHADIVSRPSPQVIARATPGLDKVGISIGGGSGHEPAMLGYVGEGLADSAAVGNFFAAPGSDTVLDSIRAADHGHGVLLLYGNYSGDVLNCRLAIKRSTVEGTDVRALFVTDDVASAPLDEASKRRGIAGDIVVFKIAGAAAETGCSLDEVERVARAANQATRSMGVALSGAELPGAAQPTFECGPGEMELGLGVHGEPGVGRVALASADEVGALLTDRIVEDLGGLEGKEILLFVNGLGATTQLELYLVYRSARRRLVERGAVIVESTVGNYITSLQMAGVSVTVTKFDDELRRLWQAPARSVAMVR